MNNNQFSQLLSKVIDKIDSDIKNNNETSLTQFFKNISTDAINSELSRINSGYDKNLRKEELITILIEKIRQGHRLSTSIFFIGNTRSNFLTDYVPSDSLPKTMGSQIAIDIKSVNIAGCPIYIDELYSEVATRINSFKYKNDFKLENKIYPVLLGAKSNIELSLNNGEVKISCKLKNRSAKESNESKRVYSIDIVSSFLMDNNKELRTGYTSISIDILTKKCEIFSLEDLVPLPPKLNFHIYSTYPDNIGGIKLTDIEAKFELEEKHFPFNLEQPYRIFKRYKDKRISFTTGWYQYSSFQTFPYIYLSKVGSCFNSGNPFTNY